MWIQHRGCRRGCRPRRGRAGSARDARRRDFTFRNALAAGVVLQAAQWAEEDGTMTNLKDGLRRRKVLAAARRVRTSVEISSGPCRRTGQDAVFHCEDPGRWCRRVREASAAGGGLLGITYQRWTRARPVWPCPSPEHHGNPVVSRSDSSPREAGTLHPTPHNPADEERTDSSRCISTGARGTTIIGQQTRSGASLRDAHA